MVNSASHSFRIVCVGDPSVKASRYRFSGAIRYAAERADLTVISVNIDASRMNSRATLDILRKITDNHPDALINLQTIFNALRENSQALPDIPTAVPVSFDISTKGHTHPVDVLGILDDEALCRAAIELALKRGQTNFAYVDTTIPSEHERSEWRFDIYRRLLGAKGHALARCPTIRSRDEFKNLRQLVDLRFREIIGHSAHAEIERLRIEKAKALLRRGDRTISEVFHACGYTNPDTFSNAFKASTGVTPSNWRKS